MELHNGLKINPEELSNLPLILAQAGGTTC